MIRSSERCHLLPYHELGNSMSKHFTKLTQQYLVAMPMHREICQSSTASELNHELLWIVVWSKNFRYQYRSAMLMVVVKFCSPCGIFWCFVGTLENSWARRSLFFTFPLVTCHDSEAIILLFTLAWTQLYCEMGPTSIMLTRPSYRGFAYIRK